MASLVILTAHARIVVRLSAAVDPGFSAAC
jgi:hypothetical protein